jgi:hypothetical protein
MAKQTVQEQVDTIKRATKKASKSKRSADKFLKDAKIIVGKPPSQQKGNQWYLRKEKGIMNFENLMKEFPKQTVISYLKIIKGIRGGQQLTQYWKTLSNGYMVYVDTLNMKIGIVQGLSANFGIMGSSKKEFDTNFKKVLKLLQQ